MSYSVEDIREHFNTYKGDASVKLRLLTPDGHPRPIESGTTIEIADLEVVTDDDGQTVYLEGTL